MPPLRQQEAPPAGAGRSLLSHRAGVSIPVFTQNYLGAGITSKIGCLMEKVSFYVPYARYAEAQDLVTALFSETGEEEEDP